MQALLAVVAFLAAAIVLAVVGEGGYALPLGLLAIPPLIFLGDDALTRRRAGRG